MKIYVVYHAPEYSLDSMEFYSDKDKAEQAATEANEMLGDIMGLEFYVPDWPWTSQEIEVK